MFYDAVSFNILLIKCMFFFLEDIYPPDEINNGEEEEENTKETRFSDVQTLLLFIGYPRSGSTLLGSILDAHPNIVMANEYNLLSQWKNYTRAQKRDKNYVFGQLWSNSVREARDLQRAPKSSYFFSYHIPGTWQGRYEDSIKVTDLLWIATLKAVLQRFGHFTFPLVDNNEITSCITNENT